MGGHSHFLSIRDITKCVKKYDKTLYAMTGDRGKVLIMKECLSPRVCWLDDNTHLIYAVRDDYLVVPLTNNWSMNGYPVPWGEDRILFRLGEIDGHKRNIEKEMRDNNQKVEESRQRHLSNEAQAFASDYHSEFKKAFSDINTASMKKTDRRWTDDKKKRSL